MKKAKKGKLIRKEVIEIPCMGALIRKYGFLSYCLSDEPTKVKIAVKI